MKWKQVKESEKSRGDSSGLYGIKYPADFDIENADFSGRDIRYSDFRLVKRLKWKQIKNSVKSLSLGESIEGIKYPSEFDIENTEFNGIDIRWSDFSLVKDLKWEHIKDSIDTIFENKTLEGIKYPEEFDVDSIDFSEDRNITYSDFSLVKGLRWEHLENVIYEGNGPYISKDLSGIKYPADFDIENVYFKKNKEGFVVIKDSDFSLVKGLRWKHIKDCGDLTGIKYPPDFDIENADLKYKGIKNSDFSLVKGLKWEQIKYVSDKSGIKYPPDFDIENANFNFNVDIRDSDFSLVSGLKWYQIKDNTITDSYGNIIKDLSGIKYPADFDIENADFSGNINITSSDFSSVKGLRCIHLEDNNLYYPENDYYNEENLRGIKYPANFDVENAYSCELNICGGDFSLVKGLRWKHLMNFYDLSGIKYPADFDIENADFWGDISINNSDFSLVRGLRWEHIKDAKSISGIRYPAEFDIENANFSGRDISGSDFSLIGTN